MDLVLRQNMMENAHKLRELNVIRGLLPYNPISFVVLGLGRIFRIILHRKGRVPHRGNLSSKQHN